MEDIYPNFYTEGFRFAARKVVDTQNIPPDFIFVIVEIGQKEIDEKVILKCIGQCLHSAILRDLKEPDLTTIIFMAGAIFDPAQEHIIITVGGREYGELVVHHCGD